MLKRTIEIKLRLNQCEFDALQNRVKRSGLSRENYLRHLLRNLTPADRPPPDYHAMMRELHAIGNNLNQIARKANEGRGIDTRWYDENAANLARITLEIREAVTLPKKLE